MATAVFTGLASGIDSRALIDSIIEARQRTNDIRKGAVERLGKENTSLTELESKVQSLSGLIDSFRTANGGGISKTASTSNNLVATATAGSNAINSSLAVNVTSLASTANVSFDDTYTGLTDQVAPNASGTQTVTVNVGQGSKLVAISVGVTSSTTVQQFIDSVNNAAGASGRISASAVNVGSTGTPDYRLVLSSLKAGTEEGAIALSVPGSGGFGGQTDLQTVEYDNATNAQFTVSGIADPIVRSSNTVSDVFPGLTFQLNNTGTTNISVTDDSAGTATQFKAVVDSFNELVKYVNDNDLVTRDDSGSDTKIVYGSLAQARVDNDFLSQFRSTLSGIASAVGTGVKSFAELGISTNRDGTLSFDEAKFKSAVNSDSVGAQDVLRKFADASAGVDGFIYQYTKFDGSFDLARSSNDSEIANLQASIDRLDRYTDKLRSNLEGQFVRLESVTARLQNQQSALTGALAGLPSR